MVASTLFNMASGRTHVSLFIFRCLASMCYSRRKRRRPVPRFTGNSWMKRGKALTTEVPKVAETGMVVKRGWLNLQGQWLTVISAPSTSILSSSSGMWRITGFFLTEVSAIFSPFADLAFPTPPPLFPAQNVNDLNTLWHVLNVMHVKDVCIPLLQCDWYYLIHVACMDRTVEHHAEWSSTKKYMQYS